MPETYDFDWPCPQHHSVRATFTPEALEDLRAALTRGDLELYCVRCGANYLIDRELQDHIHAWLDHQDRRRRRGR